MNKRIKELYKQSLEEKYQYGGSDAKPGEMYSNYITVLNPEKFAEFIIQECVELLKKEREEYYDCKNDYCDVKAEAFDEAVDLVKHYFGVEE